MVGPLLDVLFPKRCAGCGSGAWPFCGRCRARLVWLAPPWCRRCGSPAARPVASCRDCPPPALTIARAPFGFDGPVRRAIHRLKFGGWRTVADALAEAMLVAWRDASFAPEVVTWVPLSKRRLASRGYDQARALAGAVGPRLDLPVAPLLRRLRDPGPQARRGGAFRRAAMLGLFAGQGRPPARVLLVDDVLTTGATAGACAEALCSAGASEVGLLTAARAVASARRAEGAWGSRSKRERASGSPPSAGDAPILGTGLVSGSVVAPGSVSPVVDASRGRSDPRKPTLGR